MNIINTYKIITIHTKNKNDIITKYIGIRFNNLYLHKKLKQKTTKK
jgi:hypothetical protein